MRWWRRDTGAGDFLYVPPGGVHSFDNLPGEPASMLALFAPGAPGGTGEVFFAELAENAESGREPSEAERDEVRARHDRYRA